MANEGVSIWVEDSTGTELEGVSCNVRYAGSCVTNRHGRCNITLGPGSYYMTASLTGYITQGLYIYVTRDHWENVYFRKAAGNGLQAGVEGVVEDENGVRLPRMHVWAAGTLGNTASYGCISNNNGEYALGIQTSGDYVLSAGKNNYIISEAGTYAAPSTVTSVRKIDFTGNKCIYRNRGVSNRLCVSGRSIVIKDDLNISSYSMADEPVDTKIVFAKVRKWSGSLNTYNYLDDDYYYRD